MKLACTRVCVCVCVCVWEGRGGLPGVSMPLVACSQAHQRDNGQEVWWPLARGGGRGLHHGDHLQSEEHPLHVLWRHSGHLCVEVYLRDSPTHTLGASSMFPCYNYNEFVYCWM